MLKIIDNGIISHQSERGAYMPVITPLADGSLIACQQGRAGVRHTGQSHRDSSFNGRGHHMD